MKYWDIEDHQEKSRKISKARNFIKALSIIGRKGKDGRKVEEVNHIATN
jgi:hypothetical protein